MGGRAWTAEERGALLAGARDLPGRSPRAVREMVKRMGLIGPRKTARQITYDQNELATLMGVHVGFIRIYRNSGMLRGTRRGRLWLYTRSAVRSFIREHPDAVTTRVDMEWLIELLAGSRTNKTTAA
jgi:hypothetical protein